MIEIPLQLRKCPSCGLSYHPYGDEAQEQAKAHKENQIVVGRLRGTEKARSLKQLNTYWAACTFIANTIEHGQWNTKEKVDFHCRVALHFVDPSLIVVKPDGSVQFHYRSISFKNLNSIEANNYFNRAYETMAACWNNYFKDNITGEKIVELTIESIKNKY